MKTAIDAVDWYRGNYFVAGEHEKHHTHLVKGKDEGFYSAYALDVDLEASICSIREYNELVTQLSHTAGEYEFNQYLISDKTPLTKEVDYTSEEFWKYAPEGATHYNPSKYVELCEYYKLCGGDYLYYFNGEWKPSTVIKKTLDDKLIPRLQPKPVYTQEMHDKGELPSVGMACLVDGVHRELLLPIDSDGMGVIKVDGEYLIICRSALKPIDTRTDEEKAIGDLAKCVGDCMSDYGIFQAIKDGKIHGVTWSKGNE